ncbi:MAG: hypothetical protein QOK43_1923 [Acidimicrobiaceae bacterium]|nr:hypothetical protein [Acidimicrobiaceae bacterium]
MYRSFTSREETVPVVLAAVYVIAAAIGFAVWLGVWDL